MSMMRARKTMESKNNPGILEKKTKKRRKEKKNENMQEKKIKAKWDERKRRLIGGKSEVNKAVTL